MKKILLLFATLVVLSTACGICAINKSEVLKLSADYGMCAVNKPEILTLFSSKTNAHNQVWIGTFQLVFNEIKNNVIGHSIEFIGEEPTEELIGLNNAEFNKDMLNEKSYYVCYGLAKPSARDKIKKDLKEKFNTQSDILDALDWSEEVGKYYAYAMLKKQFEFFEKFDNLADSSFNYSKEKYKFFGIDKNSDSKLYNNIAVLFYNNKNDYAIRLRTVDGDGVYLYRTDKKQTLNDLYKEMIAKAERYNGNHEFINIDTFKAPKLKFKAERKYPELCNRQIKGTDLMFSEALETVEFELDEKGGKVKSEAAIMVKSALPFMEKNPKPRHFDFDKTFVMFLEDFGKEAPYMGLRIKDLSLFVR